MPAARKRARYVLRYRVTLPADGLMRWWTDHQFQDEELSVSGTSCEDAWYTLFLLHAQWEKVPPQIERLSAARPNRGRVRRLP